MKDKLLSTLASDINSAFGAIGNKLTAQVT
jgi:hypothetical protein